LAQIGWFPIGSLVLGRVGWEILRNLVFSKGIGSQKKGRIFIRTHFGLVNGRISRRVGLGGPNFQDSWKGNGLVKGRVAPLGISGIKVGLRLALGF